MQLTIKDLSEMSGYSCATISRVLTNKSNVSPKTRQAILELVKTSGYKTSVYDLMKSIEKSDTVLITVNDISNAFYVEIIRTIKERLTAEGYLSLIGITENDSQTELDYLDFAMNKNFAGVVLMTPVETPQLRTAIEKLDCPLVLVNRYLRSMDLDAVCMDNYRGGYIATEYLIQHGHKKICHFAGRIESTASMDRLNGFRGAMKDNGLPFSQDDIIHGDLKRKSGYDFGVRFAEQKLAYTAVFFANDQMAVGFCDAVAKRGLSLPEDVSVICFDDSPLVTQGLLSITTIGIASEAMGNDAVKLLLSRIEDDDQGPPHKVIHPPLIHPRDSVKNLTV